MFYNSICATVLCGSSSPLRSIPNAVHCFYYSKLSEKLAIEVDESIQRKLESGERIGPRRLASISPPVSITESLQNILKSGKYSYVGDRLPNYMEAAKKMSNFVKSRQIPMDERNKAELRNRLLDVYTKKRFPPSSESNKSEELLQMTMEERLEVSDNIKSQVRASIKSKTNLWKPISFEDETSAWCYLLGRAPPEYATLKTILNEIYLRQPKNNSNNDIKTHFDFGSGVGTALWAVNDVFGKMSEIYAVDTSPRMNDLAKLLFLKTSSPATTSSTYFRLHLPFSSERKYDIVTCSYSLMELESSLERLNVVDTLWKKTKKYLILVEIGSNAGFQIINEARDYILQLIQQGDAGHIFSPCPHEYVCPRYVREKDVSFQNRISNIASSIPCNFDVKFKTFQLNILPQYIADIVSIERFSYIVFKKGEKKEPDAAIEWHRLISQPTKLKKTHIRCQLCTKQGCLDEVLLSKGKNALTHAYSYGKQLHVGSILYGRLNKPKHSDSDI